MTARNAILTGLAVYGVLVAGISVFFSSRVRKAEDYLIAGRRIPFWIFTGGMIGTCVGTGATIGASGLAFQHGWAGSAYPMSLGLGVLLVGFFFGVMRKYDFLTLGEEIACYYGQNRLVVEASNFSLFLSQLCWLTVQIMGAGAVLNAIVGLGPRISAVIAGAIIALLCIPGGLKAVTYVAFVQGILLLTGFGTLVGVVLTKVGGFTGLSGSVPQTYFSFLGIQSLGPLRLSGLILVLVLGVFAEPGRRLPMYGATTVKAAEWGMVIAGAAVMIFSVSIGIGGMYVGKMNPHLPHPDLALPWLILNAVPPWLAGLLAVALSSAIFNSASGSANAVGTFFVRHIYHSVTGKYPKNPVLATRLGLIGAFVVSTSLALRATDIVGFVIDFLPLTATGLAIIILFGRFWRRSNWQGAVAALVVTPVTALALMLAGAKGGILSVPIIPAVIAGMVAHVTVSLFTAPSEHSFEEVVQAMKRERRMIEGEREGRDGEEGTEIMGSGVG